MKGKRNMGKFSLTIGKSFWEEDIIFWGIYTRSEMVESFWNKLLGKKSHADTTEEKNGRKINFL